MAKQQAQQQANGQQADENQEEQFTAVGPGAKDGVASEADREVEIDDKGDIRSKGGQQDDEEGFVKGDDRRAGHADDEESDEDLTPEVRAKRERRRAERKQRKEQYRRDQTELNFLRRRNEDLERRFSGVDQRVAATEQLTIDSRIAQVDDQIRLAEQIHGQAVEKGDGNSATEALRIRDDLVRGKAQLEEAKRRAAATATRRDAPRPDPIIAERAREWITDNSWYDPQLRDPDSRIAKTIEEGLYQERRLDPRSDAYWEEYKKRLAKYLPHRFESGGSADRDDEDDGDFDDDSEDDRDREVDRRQAGKESKEQKRNGKGGPAFRTGGRERTLKKGEVYVSAERRQAMEEMGVWEDPVLRNRYLRSFARYDDEAKRRRQS